jgi:AraC-like DNA-binding protein
MDVILDFRAAAHRSAFVVGAMPTAEVFPQMGTLDMIGVRFVPGASIAFLDVHARHLSARVIPAFDLLPGAADLIERLRHAYPDERRAHLEAFLLDRLRRRAPLEPARVAMAAIERSAGALDVRTLTRSLGLTERTLQRSFDRAVGLSPKQAIRIARFRSVVGALESGKRSLSELAYDCGYADQAHLTRDFTALSGLSPRRFLEERRLVGFVQDSADGCA